jgi:hypothetical protein
MLKSMLVWSALLALAVVASWATWRGPVPVRDRLAFQRAELARVGPLLAGALATGALAGLARRERVRRGEGYSSPLVAWVGKRALFLSACAVGAWAGGPVALAPAWLYAAGAGLAVGAGAYAGSLPTHL